ncbi:MAG: glycosyltransferase family 4 protein [Candidatus Eremiobacteraeota bacterium]|nr:glycosyltransferase family 4 protein [Candidatus Eremiobacteraeota bacterium]MBC5823935.1 glycosyltransferase family 4 protein [Candidatus Eremiobacteraeota bacterium]
MRVAERLINWGWEVEWFSSTYPGAAPQEYRNGIRFIRNGSQVTVHLCAWRRYRRACDFDVVVDEINTIPFYAHRYIPAPSVAYINQLAAEVWRYEAPGVIGHIAALLEPLYLRPYRDRPILTISKSSVQSLRAIGLRGPTRLMQMSVDERPDGSVPAKRIPRDVVVLGRVTPSKRIEHAIRAASILQESGWKGKLLIIGSGRKRYVDRIQSEARAVLGDHVQMLGRVSDDERSRILREASCLWMTSVREGWGLAVTEAARHGTPAVVYRVPGLVDSVKDGVTGYVVAQAPSALAAATVRLFGKRFGEIAEASLEESRFSDWDDTARHFEQALHERILPG